MWTVALDMDGVLADLDTGVFEKLGERPGASTRNAVFKSLLPKYVDMNGFAESPVLENARDLVSFLVDLKEKGEIEIIILTSTGHFYSPNSEVAYQKKVWLEKNFPELYMVPFVCTTSGKSKHILAHSRIVLIDDHLPNIESFESSGGYGIYYNPSEIEYVKGCVNNLISNP